MNCYLSNFYDLRPHWHAVMVAILLCWLPRTAASQSFEAGINAREVVLGSTFELSFTLNDAQGNKFTPPDLGNFKILTGPSEMRGMTIINGRSTIKQSWTYELEPRRTGTFSIGAAKVTVNGKQVESQPLSVRIVSPRARPNVNVPPGATDNLFITGELDRTEAYPGQQVTWRIVLYTQLSIEGADIIELPDFDGFYSKEKRRFDTRVTYRTIGGKKYAVKVLHEEALFPLETGEIAIGSAKVRIGVEQGGHFGGFLMPKPVLFQTQPAVLQVKPLPAPPPECFSGGVGQYDWSIQIDRDTLTTDDALTLTMSIRGNGDARRFAPPRLQLSDSLEVFEPKVKEEEEYENGEELVHTRVLEYVILPKEPGTYQLRPALIFFDPDSNRYRRLWGEMLPVIQVGKGAHYGLNAPVDTIAPLVQAPTDLPDIWDDLLGWFRSPVLWAVVALPFLAWGLVALFRRKRTAGHTSNAPARAPAAPVVKPTRALADLLQAGAPRAFYDALFKSLQHYLSARLMLSPAQMTQENVRRQLSERNIPSGTIQDLLSVWQTCEQALFAGQTQATQMPATLRSYEQALQVLEKSLRS